MFLEYLVEMLDNIKINSKTYIWKKFKNIYIVGKKRAKNILVTSFRYGRGRKS